MAHKITTRSLLVWAMMTGIVTGSGDVVRAQTRRMHAVMQQNRRSQPTRNPAPAYSGSGRSVGGSAVGGSVAGSGIEAQAPVERRPLPQSQPVAPGAQTRMETPRQPVLNERKDIPMASSNSRPGARSGEHLSEWMNQHSNLSPAQQQQALEKEPGFRELPQKTQQRLRDQLTQLNNMPPQQRARWMARTEAMEKLTPDQRAQVRGAMQQLAALPQEQRGPVQRSFRQLRDLPPDQRSAAMSSGRYSSQLNPAQQATLNNLMRIEPMLEPPEPRQPPR